MEGIRACYYAEHLPEAKTPAQLYAAMKRVEPSVSEIIQKSGDGWRICDRETYLSIPEFKWSEIFTMVGIPAPKGVK